MSPFSEFHFFGLQGTKLLRDLAEANEAPPKGLNIKACEEVLLRNFKPCCDALPGIGFIGKDAVEKIGLLRVAKESALATLKSLPDLAVGGERAQSAKVIIDQERHRLSELTKAVSDLANAPKLTPKPAPISPTKPSKKRGRKATGDVNADNRLYSDWTAAHKKGSTRDEFANQKGITKKQLLAALDRERHRRGPDAE
jgi:hypothetical protein